MDVDVNAATKAYKQVEGKSPLGFAARHGHLDVVKLLADIPPLSPQERDVRRDYLGRALRQARVTRNRADGAVGVAPGANPNVHSAKAIPLHVAARTLAIRSALHHALTFDGRTDLNVLSQLIARGANVWMGNEKNDTPLQVCVSSRSAADRAPA
ncbi:hypothetical protein C8F01DRAFT_1165590 [Mycena amicta]|nr:hypothetical protein C8F01DRAFT_1165590 [Mycena amicta]